MDLEMELEKKGWGVRRVEMPESEWSRCKSEADSAKSEDIRAQEHSGILAEERKRRAHVVGKYGEPLPAAPPEDWRGMFF